MKMVSMQLRETPAPEFIAELMEDGAKHLRPTTAAKIIKRLAQQTPDRESAWLLIIDGSGRLIGTHLISVGTEDRCDAAPKEIFRAAIIAGGSRIVYGHYHPNVGLDPSRADERNYEAIKEAGEILDVKVLDSIIVSREEHGAYSIGAAEEYAVDVPNE